MVSSPDGKTPPTWWLPSWTTWSPGRRAVEQQTPAANSLAQIFRGAPTDGSWVLPHDKTTSFRVTMVDDGKKLVFVAVGDEESLTICHFPSAASVGKNIGDLHQELSIALGFIPDRPRDSTELSRLPPPVLRKLRDSCLKNNSGGYQNVDLSGR